MGGTGLSARVVAKRGAAGQEAVSRPEDQRAKVAKTSDSIGVREARGKEGQLVIQIIICIFTFSAFLEA